MNINGPQRMNLPNFGLPQDFSVRASTSKFNNLQLIKAHHNFQDPKITSHCFFRPDVRV